MTTTVFQPIPPEATDPAPSIADSSNDGTLSPVTTWERVSFSVVQGAAVVVLSLVGLRGLYRFGQAFGLLEWSINHHRRRKFTRALKRVLGRHLSSAERRHWTRDHFVKTRCDKLFYLVLHRIPRERAAALLTIKNEPALQAAFARHRGVYAATFHHGALHVVAMLLSLKGYKVVGVRDRNESGLRRFMQRKLDLKYPELDRARIVFSSAFPREIYRSLQDGWMVGSSMDVSRVRAPHQRTEDVTIFGETRSFISGPLRIALRCGATIFQTVIHLDAGFRYRIEFIGPLVDPDTDHDEDSTITALMRTYAANVEHHVRATPSLMTKL